MHASSDKTVWTAWCANSSANWLWPAVAREVNTIIAWLHCQVCRRGTQYARHGDNAATTATFCKDCARLGARPAKPTNKAADRRTKPWRHSATKSIPARAHTRRAQNPNTSKIRAQCHKCGRRVRSVGLVVGLQIKSPNTCHLLMFPLIALRSLPSGRWQHRLKPKSHSQQRDCLQPGAWWDHLATGPSNAWHKCANTCRGH